MDLSATDYAGQLRALLPAGPAWHDELTQKLLDAWAQEFKRLDGRIGDLLNEADPRLAVELLPDWERLLGLPDGCTVGVSLSLDERRRAAWHKLTAQGDQSRAYFIGMAEKLGVPGCTITEFRQANCNSHCNDALYSQADEFVWRVNVPLAVDNARMGNCNDDCNDALQMYTPNLIECPIRARKPAHTEVIFSYQT
jgi:uncharacterized protein YmfQ (DUF2313 family)